MVGGPPVFVEVPRIEVERIVPPENVVGAEDGQRAKAAAGWTALTPPYVQPLLR